MRKDILIPVIVGVLGLSTSAFSDSQDATTIDLKDAGPIVARIQKAVRNDPGSAVQEKIFEYDRAQVASVAGSIEPEYFRLEKSEGDHGYFLRQFSISYKTGYISDPGHDYGTYFTVYLKGFLALRGCDDPSKCEITSGEYGGVQVQTGHTAGGGTSSAGG